MGVAYGLGRGVPQVDVEAAAWYRRAAEQSVVEAQFNLGLFYWDGRGVPQDYVEAHKWLNLAAAQGYDLAVRNRDDLARRMTREQVAEAQRRASEWFDSSRNP